MLGGQNPFWHVLSLHSYRPALNSSELSTDSSTVLGVFSTVTDSNEDKRRCTNGRAGDKEAKARDRALSTCGEAKGRLSLGRRGTCQQSEGCSAWKVQAGHWA